MLKLRGSTSLYSYVHQRNHESNVLPRVCVCVCVCVCDAQFFQIMLKLRGSTMMRPTHEFWCSVALPPGLRNWVEMARNMQQEGVGCVCVCAKGIKSIMLKLRGSTFLHSYHYCKP